jgi:prepilin-type N-terminal cleavage/methylation domain-containing protein
MQSTPQAFRTSRLQRGFSLFELMMALAIAGVLVGLAAPNMRSFTQNNRLTAASNDLLRAFQIARSESITRQRTVVVCASNNPTADTAVCSYDAFTGWIVFEDNNNNWQRDDGDTLIDQHNTINEELTVRTDNDAIVSFNSTGFANLAGARTPSANVVICDARYVDDNPVEPDGPSVGGRALVITPTGRARVTKVATEVKAARMSTGEACP